MKDRPHPSSSLFLAVLTVCAFLGLAMAADAQPAPSGPQFRVDGDVPIGYSDLAVAGGPDGGFAFAWTETRAGAEAHVDSVRARRYDAAGGRLGPAVTLAEESGGEVDVAVNRAGEALVVWFKPWVGIKARLLDSAGRPLGSLRSLDTARDFDFGQVQVLAHPDGGFLAAWRRENEYVARRIFANGALGPQVDLPFSLDICNFAVFDMAVNRRGDVALVCIGMHRHTLLQILDPSLHRRGRIVRIPMPAPWCDRVDYPSVEFGTDDELVITGEAYSPGREAVFAQLYDLKSRSVAPPVQIDEGGFAMVPALTTDGAGSYLFVWQNFDADELLGRVLEPSGRLGPTFSIDPDFVGQGRNWQSRVAALGAGSFVVASFGRYGILGQRFASDSPGQIVLRHDRSVASEGEGQAVLEAVRREGSRGEVLASWSALAQDALPGGDFEEESGTVTFADGDSLPKRIVIPLRDDGRPEGDETFRVELRNPEGGATLGRLTAARVEIRDDDTPSPLLAGAGPAVRIRELVPSSTEFLYLACCHDVASLPTGGFVAAWQRESGPSEATVEFALFDAAGQPVGTGHTSGPAGDYVPRLLPRPDGGFVLIWRSGTQDLGDVQGWYAQSFDAGGEPLGDEIPLAGFLLAEGPLRVAQLPDGGFVAVGRRKADSHLDFFLERYDMDGRRLTQPVEINERPVLDPLDLLKEFFLDGHLLQVAASPSGVSLVVWPRLPAPGRPGGVFARLVSASGVPLGSEILVGSTAGVIGRMAVAAAPDGGFVVAWESNRDGDRWGISARWLDASGVPLGGEVTVNSTTAGDQTRPKAAFDSTGDLLIIWRNESALQGQLFSGPGQREGNAFIIDDGAGSLPANPAVTATGPGEWQVLWSSVAADVSHGSVYTRRLARTGE